MNLLRKALNNSIEINDFKKESINQLSHVNLCNKTLLIKLSNCRIVRNGCLVNDYILIRDGEILDPEQVFYTEKRLPNLEIDCDDLIIAPGFIDIQVNGGFGVDFTNDTENIKDNLKKVSFQLLKYGVTAYCPTIVSSHHETYSNIISQIQKTNGRTNENLGASILGIHLEGPFINSEKVGAHDLSTLSDFKYGLDSLEKIYGPLATLLENCKIITLAPELDLTGEIIEYLTRNNIIVSLGHSAASLKDAENAVNKGARCITHLFNAMGDFHHRSDPHLIGLILKKNLPSNCIYYGIISDGVHTHSSAINSKKF